jgi:beta-lactamase regulating signal transducer with metallopeptidase domain
MSPLLTATFAGLLWKPLALALVALLASFALRTAALRHALWTTVLASLFLLPILSFLLPPLPVLSEPAPVLLYAPPIRLAFSQPGMLITMRMQTPGSSPVSEPAPRTPLAVLLYAGIAAAFLLRLALSYRRARAVVNAATPVAIVEAEPVAVALSIPWPLPSIRESTSVAAPSVAGYARPVVLLPLDWRTWPQAKLRAVLAHELAHVRRSDWAIALAAEIARCLYWFHPLAWWLPRHLSTLAEQCCDDLAVSLTGDAPAYAEVLLDAASRHGRAPAAGIAMASSSNVGRRIERILKLHSHNAAPLPFLRWAAIAACTVPVLTTISTLHVLAQQPAIGIPDPMYQSPAPTPDQVAELERSLLINPEDHSARLRLTTYYMLNAMPEKRVPHVFWLIEHHPDSALHRHNSTSLDPGGIFMNAPADYDRGASLWNRQVEIHPNNLDVLQNAARFYTRKDLLAAEKTLNRVRLADPARAEALQLLVDLYSAAISSTFTRPDWAERPFNSNPAFVQHAREFIESTPEAVFPGRVGLRLVGPLLFRPDSPPSPEVVDYYRRRNELGAQFLQRAQQLEPDNPEWRVPPPNSPQPLSTTPNLPVVTSTVLPKYPPAALQARIQGDVRFEATLSPEGSPTAFKLLSGHPLLVRSAQEAAHQSRHPERAGQTVIIAVPFRLP